MSSRRQLVIIKKHFQNLFERLRLLSTQFGIIIDPDLSTWNVVETSFGSIEINKQGDIMIDSCVWEKMTKKLDSEGKGKDHSTVNIPKMSSFVVTY